MRNSACELQESSKELINIYRGTLATGHQQRRPIFHTGTHITMTRNTSLLCITTITYYSLFRSRNMGSMSKNVMTRILPKL
jgi:hypothetical protein